VKPTEHTAKSISTSKTGIFAVLCGLLRDQKSGVSSASGIGARFLRSFLLLATMLAALALTGMPAQAATTHKFIEQMTGFGSAYQIAVGGEGEVYVADLSTRAVDRFSSTGVALPFSCATTECKKYLDGNKITGTPSGAFGRPAGVAVDDENGDVYVSDSSGVVDVFSSTGEYLPTLQLTGTPGGPFSSPEGLAFDQATHELYVADNENAVVDLFTAAGTYVKQLGEGVLLPHDSSVAVSEGGLTAGDVYVQDLVPSLFGATERDVDVFEALGNFIPPPWQAQGAFSSNPMYVGVDPTNQHVYADSDHEGVVDEFGASASEEYIDRLTGTPTGVNGTIVPFIKEGLGGVAIAPTTGDLYVTDVSVVDVFGPDIVYPDVTTAAASEVRLASAVLNGTVDPDGAGEATCEFEYGASTSYEKIVPCAKPVPSVNVKEPVKSVVVPGLQPHTTYYYRLTATNASKVVDYGECPEDCGSFTTAGPSLHGEAVSDVTATSATLDATIDPNNGPSSAVPDTLTSYYFQYNTSGTEVCTAQPSLCKEAPVAPGASLGESEGKLEVSQHLQGLAANTVYHYRVVAVSEPNGEPVTVYESDQTFTTEPSGSAFALPDHRQYEMVSPPDKHGALISAIGAYGPIEAAADGDAFTYETDSPIEAEPQGYTNAAQDLATRTATGWSNQDLETRHNESTGVAFGSPYEYRFFSSDLSLALFNSQGYFTPLTGEETSPQATEATPYERNDAICRATPATCYTPLLTSADVTSGAAFGEVGKVTAGAIKEGPVKPMGATPDLRHVVLGVEGKGKYESLFLTEQPAPPASLYEWSADKPPSGQLQLINILPASEGGAPAASPAFGGYIGGYGAEARNAISVDGSRVIWSTSSALYMRDTVGGHEETVRLDVVQPGASGSGTPKPQFNIASGTGSEVFFTDTQQLTVDSRGAAGEPDLYACHMVEVEGKLKCELADLTVDSNPDGEPADVQGAVLAASEDGTYVYFVADGRLTSVANDRGGTATAGESNLYVEHYNGTAWEAPRFIATLSVAESNDWFYGRNGKHTSGSSPDGQYLAFMSQRPLTGYDNTDVNERPSHYEEETSNVSAQTTVKHSDEEVYEYDAETAKLVCASCNPTGTRPSGEVYAPTHEAEKLVGGYGSTWEGGTWLAANIPGWTSYEGNADYGLHQPRYLSDSGRLLFNSHEALVPQDVNGMWDVYEYEPPGIGSCTESISTYSPRSGGCVNLISSGESSEESAFLDASESGGDVFFLTALRLVPADYDNNFDVYDARECTGESQCFPVSAEKPPVCTTEASCRLAPTPQPTIFGAPPSQTFNGVGNLTSESSPPPAKATTNKTVKCKKGFTKSKKNKCVRSERKKKSKKAKKSSYDRRGK
jgi:hypothetical protein